MEKNNEKTPKIAQKETKSLITTSGKIYKKQGKTKVRRVMETIYGFNRPLKIQEIVRDTGFTKKQIFESLRFLFAVGMITKNYENLGAKHKIPPRRSLIVSLSKSQFKRARRFLYR